MRLAVSFRSVDQARHWLAAEVPDWDPDGLRARARAAWEPLLSRMSFGPTPADEQRALYTALWHSMVQPRDRTGDNWPDDEPFFDDHYTLWDSWKTLFPLLDLVDRRTSARVVNSFVARHRHNKDGYVATAFVAGLEYRTGQGGDEADNVIADAYAKGVTGVDWPAAYDLLKWHADRGGRTADYRSIGFATVGVATPYCRRFHSGSGTLAFAQNDYSAALVARGLGHDADAARWLARSRNWRNVWDAAAADAGFTGFPRSRKSDGAFTTDGLRKDYNVDFYEATSWEACFMPVYDRGELVARMGGRPRFLDRLTYALDHGLIDFGNEPSFMTIWLFAAEGRPDLTADWAAKYRDLYRGAHLPGDDDQGAMSSMYLFLCAGIYPDCRAGPVLPARAERAGGDAAPGERQDVYDHGCGGGPVHSAGHAGRRAVGDAVDPPRRHHGGRGRWRSRWVRRRRPTGRGDLCRVAVAPQGHSAARSKSAPAGRPLR